MVIGFTLAMSIVSSTNSNLSRVGWLLRSNAVSARMARFGAIGLVSTLANWILFFVVRSVLSATWATLIALLISTIFNTAAQRRYTFGNGTQKSAYRDHLMSILAFGGAWLLSIWAIDLLHSFHPDANAAAELVVSQICILTGSALRFALLQIWSKNC